MEKMEGRKERRSRAFQVGRCYQVNDSRKGVLSKDHAGGPLVCSVLRKRTYFTPTSSGASQNCPQV